MTHGAPFNEPRIAINRVYTRHGDGGSTRLVGGQNVSKSDLRLEAYGTVDELNAFVGACRCTLGEMLRLSPPSVHTQLDMLSTSLLRIQHELFNLGSILATLPADIQPKQPRVTQAEIEALEQAIDARQNDLVPLRSFVLPGGTRINADLHIARTVCRRAERACVALQEDGRPIDSLAIRYLNRLSDLFFVWSRYVSLLVGASEILWEPNLASSAQ